MWLVKEDVFMNEGYENNQRKEIAADSLATAAFVFGIISLFSTICCCPFLFSALGIILALLSKGAEEVLRPRAKTGLILSVIGFVISIILVVFSIGFPLFMFMTNPQYKENMIETYEETLEENEGMFRQTYGDEVYEQMQELIDGFK